MPQTFPTEYRKVVIEYEIKAPESPPASQRSESSMDPVAIAMMAAEMVRRDSGVMDSAVAAVSRAMRRGRAV